MRTPHLRALAVSVGLVAALFAGCEDPPPAGAAQAPQAGESRAATANPSLFEIKHRPDFRDDVHFPAHDRAARVQACALSGSGTLVDLVASEAGLAGAWAGAPGGDVRIQRLRGEGCALEPVGRPLAAAALLDADDLGRVYVFPAESTEPGVLSTMLPDEYRGSMVARVDAAGQVIKLLPAGRGIWGFGVSPRGDALWVSACGPTGIYSVAGETVDASLAPPATLWQEGSVLTGPETLFSVGYQTCAWDAPLSEGCGLALVRTTAAGSTEVGSAVADLGAGAERATLSRCGAGRVCGLLSEGIRIWDELGAVVATFDRAALALSPDEHPAAATGNASGVYVMAQSEASSRVVFVPR